MLLGGILISEFSGKIDNNKKQLIMKKMRFILLLLIAVTFGCKSSQKINSTSISKKIPKNILIVLDGVPSNHKLIENIDENEIVEITVLKGDPAISLYGRKAKNGVILITSRKGAMRIYQKNLSTLSPEYSEKIKKIKDEKDIVYIIDSTPLIENYEVKLLHLKPNQIKEIKTIDSNETKLKYGLERKAGGIIINLK